MASAHAMSAHDTPVMREGCCNRCLLEKSDWMHAAKCKRAARRTVAYQTVANHRNPFKLPGFKE
eukprot:550902-Prymnesium_polylepis.1